MDRIHTAYGFEAPPRIYGRTYANAPLKADLTPDGSGFSTSNEAKKSEPSLSDGADAERLVLEAKHARRLTRILRAQLRELLPADMTPDAAHGVVAKLHALEKPLRDALYAMLLEGARLGADHGRQQVEHLQGTAR